MCLGRFGNFRKLGTMGGTLSETMYEDVQGVSTLGHLRDLRDRMRYRLGTSTARETDLISFRLVQPYRTTIVGVISSGGCFFIG